jgi:hypothetical protein
MIADRDQVWLTTERIQVCTKDLDFIAYLCTFASKVTNWIPMKIKRVEGQA